MSQHKKISPKAFISYSHDSESHKEKILGFSNKLREDGVDAILDRYIHSPEEGWPMWMLNNIQGAEFVIVVCTEKYFQRISGSEKEGIGNGVKWEGSFITQALYESGMRNKKYIPVVFSQDDLKFIPSFLRPWTHYELTCELGYEDLLRHLTGQPKTIKPPLGVTKILPIADHQTTSLGKGGMSGTPKRQDLLVLILDSQGKSIFFFANKVERKEKILIEVADATPEASTFFNLLLKSRRSLIYLSYGKNSFEAQFEEANQIYEDNKEKWFLTFQERESRSNNIFSESAFGTLTADDIARIRAERILLDKKLDKKAKTSGGINDTFLEVFIEGVNAPLKVKESPFPAMFSRIGSDMGYFIEACKLVAIMLLKSSNTVENVLKFEIEEEGRDSLKIHFEGLRPQRWANEEPFLIKVIGVCKLT